MNSFTGTSKDIDGLLEIINEKAEDALFKISSFAPHKPGEVLIDSRDGNKYKTTIIGNQVWMAENLNYNASSSKCFSYLDDYCQKYGRLYDWNTAKSSCPKGWHLPSDAEWDVLMKSVNPACSPKGNCANAGKLLKAKFGWHKNNTGTDAFDFAALPGGYGSSDGRIFSSVDSYGFWWSATEYSAYDAYSRIMDYTYDDVIRYGNGKNSLFSVRCLKD